MRVKSMLLFRDVERRHVLIHRCRQRRQLRPSFNSDPEHSRRPRAGKESRAAKTHFKGVSLYGFQQSLDFLNLFLGFFADELQSDVQRIRPRPARIWSKSAHAIEEAGNSAAEVV